MIGKFKCIRLHVSLWDFKIIVVKDYRNTTNTGSPFCVLTFTTNLFIASHDRLSPNIKHSATPRVSSRREWLQAVDTNSLVNVNLWGASASMSVSVDDPIKLVATEVLGASSVTSCPSTRIEVNIALKEGWNRSAGQQSVNNST